MAQDNHQERTEQPTQRKLERSREEGQIAYSSDLTGGVALLLSALLFALLGNYFLKSLSLEIVELLATFGDAVANKEDHHWHFLLIESTWNVALICLPIVSVAFATTLLIGGVVTGFQPSPKALKVDFEKLIKNSDNETLQKHILDLILRTNNPYQNVINSPL